MKLLRGRGVDADWEPIPWTPFGWFARKQRRGFRDRSLRPIEWQRVDWQDFPANGVLGYGRDWFASHDIVAIARCKQEDLVLIRNPWHGFPDPPEWGVWSRPSDKPAAKWKPWGHFPVLPPAWSVPDDLL